MSIGIAFTIITMLHMTLGEQAPKMWALRRAEGTALRTAPPLRVFTLVFWPFIAVVNGISNWMLRVAGLPPGTGHEPSHSAEEIRGILALSARGGHISDRELELTQNVFRMIELEVRHIVVPRIDVEYLSLERSLEQNLDSLREASHSRFPLCEADPDTIVGFVHTKDILEQVLSDKTPDLRALALPSLFVSDSMPLPAFLLHLQTERAHAAAVVDERGTVVGLAFREDALEEIVGPLGDEFDEAASEFRELEPGVYELCGGVPLPEVADRLDFGLEPDEEEGQDTIGGHVTARLQRLARKGDEVAVGPYRATVLEVARRRVHRLRLEPTETEQGTHVLHAADAGLPEGAPE